MVDFFGMRKRYKRLLDENFYKFIVSLFALSCAPLGASIIFDYIVIYGSGRLRAGILLGIVLLLVALLLVFISIAIWAAVNSNVTGERRVLLIISAYLMIWFAFGNLFYFFCDTENFVAAKPAISASDEKKDIVDSIAAQTDKDSAKEISFALPQENASASTQTQETVHPQKVLPKEDPPPKDPPKDPPSKKDPPKTDEHGVTKDPKTKADGKNGSDDNKFVLDSENKDVENEVAEKELQLLQKHQTTIALTAGSVESMVKSLYDTLHVTKETANTTLRNVPQFWKVEDSKDKDGNHTLIPSPINRVEGYIDCFYFSGITILTIGYGDIVPISRSLKILVLIEGFLGQFINVVAIGMWLSGKMTIRNNL